MLNTFELNSGELLQINCATLVLDNKASFLYQILINGKSVANDTKSFVNTIKSVKSTDAGNYTCQVSLADAPYIVKVSDKKNLSGKSTAFYTGFIITAK